MRTILYAIVVFLMLPVLVSAAPNKNPNDIRKYKTELNLTNAQLIQLDKIYGDYQAKVKLQAPAANKKTEIMNMLAKRKELRLQVRKVLSSDQQKKVMELRTQKKVVELRTQKLNK